MITVLNYSGHELAPSIEVVLAQRLGGEIDVRELSRNLDLTDLANEAQRLVDAARVAQSEWGATPPVVILPTLGIAAAVLLATIHGVAGYFPRVVWLRRDPATGAFDVWEQLDLAAVREVARTARWRD